MKCYFSLFLLLPFTAKAQEWQAELMAGVAGYNGDLTEKRVTLNQLKPAVSFNIKYNSGDFINLRAGITYAKIGADDKNNKSADLQRRNLSFKTDIIEFNVAAEINFADPEVYTAYPYAVLGVGFFHFNPYTLDASGKKTYLQPLSTEGEGLKEYPGRKKYSLTQLCLPIGLGFKIAVNQKWDISYEIGYRLLLTDYLDDVSKSYVDVNTLATEKGQESASLSYRGSAPFNYVGEARGNPTIKDIYFFTGIKIATYIGNLSRKR